MTESDQFYLERDSRTALCIGGQAINQIPVHVVLDAQAASSRPGQGAALALANQLARIHRNVIFILPDGAVPLLVPTLFPAPTLSESILQTVKRIDPYGRFDAQNHAPAESALSIGIGESTPKGLTWYIGAARALAFLDRNPCQLDTSHAATLRGAALASCLGASALFRTALTQLCTPRTLSCWDYAEGSDADPGPSDIPAVDVGTSLIVGVGAVGSALIYWLNLFGVSGSWILVDPDLVDITNTNRQLLFVPADAGWNTGNPSYKVHVASRFLPNCQPLNRWYEDCAEIKNLKFDAVLALANEHDVRTRLAQRNPAAMLHATTGQNWLSELHRHILGTDDCIRCRMNDIRTPRLACSTSTLPADIAANAPDAALTFISAASGLMLATALQKLQCGELHEGMPNNWRWYFDSTHRMASAGQRACQDGCNMVPPFPLRRNLNKQTRWASLIS